MRTKAFQVLHPGVIWLGLGLAILAGLVLSGPARSGEAQDRDRLVAAGGEYSAGDFANFPGQATPFAAWRRVDSSRLVGRAVYATRDNIRVWKTLFCGPRQTIYLELSLLDKAGQRHPFGWQDCAIGCRPSGVCDETAALYLDLNGDGKPEIRFKSLGAISTTTHSGQTTLLTFNVDVIPDWLRAKLGPNWQNLSPIGPDQTVGAWRDHPLDVKDSAEGLGHGGSRAP